MIHVGTGLLIPCNCQCDRNNNEWIITISQLRTDWKEWIKTIGILQNDTSPYLIKFRTGIYSFTVTPAVSGMEVRTIEQHTKEGKTFVKMLKQVFRKAACCVMCRVCEADCPYGCLVMKDGKVHVSDKCHHCSGCHKPLMGCHVYHSTFKRSTGKYARMIREGEKNNEPEA